MANTIQISPNTTYVGCDILCTIDPVNTITGTITITRITTETRRVVRGAYQYPVNSSTFSITDIECPLDLPMHYEFRHDPDPPAPGPQVVNSSTITLADTPNMAKYSLRSLFQPLALYASGSEMDQAIGIGVGLGQFDDVEHRIRGGLFSVIGRSDPVLVFDSSESLNSMIPIVTYDAAATERVRSIVRSGDPLLLQTPDSMLVGDEGVLYCQPITATERRPVPQATDPRRVFEIKYVQIAIPDSATVLSPVGRTYDQIMLMFGTYGDVVLGNATYKVMAWGDKWS